MPKITSKPTIQEPNNEIEVVFFFLFLFPSLSSSLRFLFFLSLSFLTYTIQNLPEYIRMIEYTICRTSGQTGHKNQKLNQFGERYMIRLIKISMMKNCRSV